MFRGEDFFGLNKDEKPFVVTQNSRISAFEASYGPFRNCQHIQDPVGRFTANHSVFGNGIILHNLEISAHLVSVTVPPDRPILQVLFHASHYDDNSQKGSSFSKSNSLSTCTRGYYLEDNAEDLDPSFCMQVHVQKDNEELTSVCVLEKDHLVCIAEVKVPRYWWSENERSRSVNVYYSVYNMGPNSQCSRSRNRVDPDNANLNAEKSKDQTDDNHKAYAITKRFVSTVSLSHGLVNYQELKEDDHIIIHVPQKSFYPGSQFRVPIKLQKGSQLDEFTVR